MRVGFARILRNTAFLAARARVERGIPFWAERGLAPRDFRTAADLERVPLLERQLDRVDLPRFLSSRYGEGSRQALQTTSSGHSGVQGIVYWDYAGHLGKMAIAERDRGVVAELVGRRWAHRQLYFLPEASASLNLRAWWDSQIVRVPRLAMRHFFPADRSFDEAADRLDELAPDVVYSYGSWADGLVRHLRGRSRRTVAPRVWVYGGDMLPPDGRLWIEEWLGCPVYSTYQSIETGRLGFQCERREGFHLNVDLCAARMVDREGRTVSAGERGGATVLLNYRLGDCGVMSAEPCPCGRALPLLAQLDGRVSEIIRLGNGTETTSIILRNLLRASTRPRKPSDR